MTEINDEASALFPELFLLIVMWPAGRNNLDSVVRCNNFHNWSNLKASKSTERNPKVDLIFEECQFTLVKVA